MEPYDRESDKGGKKLKPFQGKSEDWLSWKWRFQEVLEASDLCDFLLKTAARPEEGGEAQDKWDTTNHKIFAKLAQYTEDAPYDMVTQFVEQRDGMQAWKDLVNKYELRGNVQKAVQVKAHC